MTSLARFLRDAGGEVAVEYGIVLMLVSLGGVAAYVKFGQELSALYDDLANTVGNITDAAVAR